MNGTTSTFTYRGDGLRNSRTTGGNTTTFTWDINAALPVVLDDGNRYVYGAGLESMLTATGTYYYLADGLGSTMAMVDSTGIVAKSYTYDVYGKPTSTGALPNEYDFAGQQTDPTGLQYLRARYMDPETGTFISRDPLTALPSWIGSPYGYGSSNPVSHIDPLGLADVVGTDPWDDGGYTCNVGWCFVTNYIWHYIVDGRRYALTLPDGAWLEEFWSGGQVTDWQVCSFVGEKKDCHAFDPFGAAREADARFNLEELAEQTYRIIAVIYETNAAARAAAKVLGWEEVGVQKGVGKDQVIFKDKKGNFYVRDLDGHKGAAWKRIDKNGNVLESLDEHLNVVKTYK
ncbi:MAG: RHS repeat-associated core domain-containing protein [Dehalococcoidia bacterium]|nr:RHS repeat-associated core domain-containing protein [Dehalococcoidia bacterium]